MSESGNLLQLIDNLFGALPPGYAIFKYFVVGFVICYAFVFVIDFIKIIFNTLFKGGVI